MSTLAPLGHVLVQTDKVGQHWVRSQHGTPSTLDAARDAVRFGYPKDTVCALIPADDLDDYRADWAVPAIRNGVKPEQVAAALCRQVGLPLSREPVPRWPAWYDRAERARADFERSFREVQITLAADARPMLEALMRASVAVQRHERARRKSWWSRFRLWLAS